MLKYRFIYLILLILLWTIRILYLFRITAVIFYVFLLLPVVLFALLFIQAARIKQTFGVSSRIVEKGKPFSLELCLENRNFLPLGKMELRIKYKNVLSDRWIKQKFFFSPEKGTKKYCFSMISDYSAKLEVQMTSVKLYDILNLFSIQKLRRRKWLGFFRRNHDDFSKKPEYLKQTKYLSKKPEYFSRKPEEISLIVMPNLHELTESPVCANPYVIVESNLYSDVKSGDDMTEIFGIREYEQGDRMNRIHWKLSAKEEHLMVKEFGLPVDCSILILVNIGKYCKNKKELECRDAILEAAFSLSFRMVTDGQIHFLAWHDAGKNTIERVKIANEQDFYEAIGQMLSSGRAKSHRRRNRKENVPLLYFSEYGREQYSNLFYIAKAGENVRKTKAAMPQRAMPQRAMPQRAMPQRAMSQGAMRQGAMPQGAMPQGAMPQRAMSQGAMPQGAMPLAALEEFEKASMLFEEAQVLKENRKSAWLSMIFVCEQNFVQGHFARRNFVQGHFDRGHFVQGQNIDRQKKQEGIRMLEESGVLAEMVTLATLRDDLNRIVLRKGGTSWEGED